MGNRPQLQGLMIFFLYRVITCPFLLSGRGKKRAGFFQKIFFYFFRIIKPNGMLMVLNNQKGKMEPKKGKEGNP